VTVTCNGALVVPTVTAPKFRPTGDSVIGQNAVAARLKVCTVGPDDALSTAVTEPTIDPPLVGVRETVKPHLARAARTSPFVQGAAPDGVTP
jgi:hypothetical protein